MAYEKQTWTTGEVITQEKLNHMEDGIANAGVGNYEFPTYPIIAGVWGSPEEIIRNVEFETIATPGGDKYYGCLKLPAAISLKAGDILISAEEYTASSVPQSVTYAKGTVTENYQFMWLSDQTGGMARGYTFIQRPDENNRKKVIITYESQTPADTQEEAIENMKALLSHTTGGFNYKYIGLFVYRPPENI